MRSSALFGSNTSRGSRDGVDRSTHNTMQLSSTGDGAPSRPNLHPAYSVFSEMQKHATATTISSAQAPVSDGAAAAQNVSDIPLQNATSSAHSKKKRIAPALSLPQPRIRNEWKNELTAALVEEERLEQLLQEFRSFIPSTGDVAVRQQTFVSILLTCW
eukprot:3609930-Rhodomonas_salina.4